MARVKQIPGATLVHLRRVFGPNGERTRWGEPFTVAYAAEKVHISATHLSRVELGRTSASASLLFRLADLYGLADQLELVHAYYRNGRRQAQRTKPAKPRGTYS